MASVFVSHASADQALVDDFVDLVLRNGCGLVPSEIFYSSGADTGVPDGQDLLAHVRDQVSETGLVVAMLTPTFPTRPVCVAELGAAWGRTGKLFPLLAPGVDRSSLDGVLTTALVEYMDDEGALDRLHQRVADAVGKGVEAATWTRAKKRWIARLNEIVASEGIVAPTAIAPAEHQRVMQENVELGEALASAERDLDQLREQLEAVSALKDADDVAEVSLPTDTVERFESLVLAAKDALADVGDSRVARAIVAEFSDTGGLPSPGDDDWERQKLFELVDAGLLTTDEGLFWASDAFPAHDAAREAVGLAIAAVVDDPPFETWFAGQFESHPRMKNLEVLSRVFLNR